MAARKIVVKCPECHRVKRVTIPEDFLDELLVRGELLVLRLRPGDVCQHRFNALLDWHFSLRDYEFPVGPAEEKMVPRPRELVFDFF
jgi:hypothetical protein